jgi:hypothetical protein
MLTPTRAAPRTGDATHVDVEIAPAPLGNDAWEQAF